MEYIGLILEVLFLVFGVYLYLFAIGRFRSKDQSVQQKADQFREQNGWWMRILALAVVAIMAINIYLHLLQIVN